MMRSLMFGLGLLGSLAVPVMGEEIRIDQRVNREQMATLPFRPVNIGLQRQEFPETDGQATTCHPTNVEKTAPDSKKTTTKKNC